MTSCVIAMSPKTLTWNIASKSVSAMSPTFSTPSTKPALLTMPYICQLSKIIGEIKDTIGRTKDVDVTEVLRDLVKEGCNLLLVGDIELDSSEFTALLKT